MNLVEHIFKKAASIPSKTALVYQDQKYTYQEIMDSSLKIASGLQKKGIREGDHVGLFLPNTPDFIFCYYGILSLGAVAVSCNVMSKKQELQYLLCDAGVKVLITDKELLKEIPTLQEIEKLEHILCTGPGLYNHTPLKKITDRHPFDNAAILYTSGTTGQPKGAVLTHNNVITNILADNHYTQTTANDVLIGYLPLFHCFGQNSIMNAAFEAGSTMVLHKRFQTDEVLESLVKNKVTVFFGVPTIYHRLNLSGSIDEYFNNVRYFFSAAAIMDKNTSQSWWDRFKIPIHEGYGLTESSPFASYNHFTDFRLGSVGTPIEGVSMQVVDAEGNTLGPEESGEILIKGPNVMKGYHNRPLETREVLKDGWLHTGDVGCYDPDGYYYIKDRIKDMINVSGFKVWPREIEEVLNTCPGVRETAVIGTKDLDSGETVHAVIVKQSNHHLDQKQIIAYCRERLSNYKIPKGITFQDSLPKNPAGKILKKNLRRQFENKEVK